MRDIPGESPLEVEQDIAEKELTEMVPTRMHKRRVTTDCMVGNDGLPSSCNAYEPDEWVWLAAEPTHKQRRRLITTAVSVIADTVTRNHTYKPGDTFCLHRQEGHQRGQGLVLLAGAHPQQG